MNEVFAFENDRVAKQVEMTNRRLQTRVGYSSRVRRRPIPLQPVIAAKILAVENFTIDYRPETEEMKHYGFKSIWQFIAYRHPINEYCRFVERPTECDRFDSVRDHARIMMQAFSAFRRHFLDDHREHPLLMLPRTSDRKQIELITFNKDYPINEAETALDVFRVRARSAVKGKMKSAFDMMEAIGGSGAMREIASHVEKYIHDEYVNGPRQPMLAFSDNTEADAHLSLV